MHRLLTSLGFHITEASDGHQATELSQQQAFDLILMDIQMPKINGLEATRAILANEDIPNIPIIAVTACAFEIDRVETLAAGCCSYLTKPYKIEQLLDTIQTHLPIIWEFEQNTHSRLLPEPMLKADPERLLAPQLTADWLNAFETAVISGKNEQMESMIKTLELETPALAQQVLQWAHDYDYEKILVWIEKQRSTRLL